MIKVALTGGGGLVGSRIVEILESDKNLDVYPLSRKEMDITNREDVFNTLNNLNFDIFIHLAAYTNVDMAEIEREKAWKVNVEGTRNVFDAVHSLNKNFIYISTDFVFDGKKQNTPFFEDPKPNPISYYGLTKYEGEKIVNGNGIIIRISYPYRTKFNNKKDIVRRIKSLLKEGKTISMVSDSLMVPTFIDDIGYALKKFISLKNFKPQIFHFVGAQSLSPYEFGRIIAKTFDLDESLIKQITYKEYFKGKAKRPQFSDIRSKNNNFYKMQGFEEVIYKFKDEFE